MSWLDDVSIGDDRSPMVGHPQDFLVGGGPGLCVDTDEMERMGASLQHSAQALDVLSHWIPAEQSRLAHRYYAVHARLVRLCETPEGAAEYGPQLEALESAWVRFEDAAALACHASCGTVALSQKIESLSQQLERATGMYKLTEDDLRNLFGAFDFETIMMHLVAHNLALREYFPASFTVDGRVYRTKQMSDTELAAVFLSWMQAKLGTQYYGASNSLQVSGNGSNTILHTPGFEDSPELNAAFDGWFDKVSPQELIHAYEWDDPLTVAGMLIFGPIQFFIYRGILEKTGVVTRKTVPFGEQIPALWLRTYDQRAYAKFAASQQETRDIRRANFSNTPTGKLIGINRAQRLERKLLATQDYNPRVQGGGAGQGWTLEGSPAGATRTFPKKPGDVFRYSNTIDPYGDNGAFEIQRWRDAAGQKGVRVILRGTESWDAGSGMPQDMLTNTEAVAGLKTGPARAVTAALQSMGVDSATPVELVGHSQAGIVAANLAADPSFTSHYNVRSVITAGSPVAGAMGRVPENIHMISFENSNDLVPKLEAGLNPGSTNHVTVWGNRGSLFNIPQAHNRDSVYANMADDFLNAHYSQGDYFLNCRNNDMNLNHKIVFADSQRFEMTRN